MRAETCKNIIRSSAQGLASCGTRLGWTSTIGNCCYSRHGVGAAPDKAQGLGKGRLASSWGWVSREKAKTWDNYLFKKANNGPGSNGNRSIPERERAEIQQVEGDLIGVRGPENPSGRHLSESIWHGLKNSKELLNGSPSLYDQLS